MIIGLCGYGRSGKDTLATMLGEEHGFQRFAFADKVRATALEIDPWIGDGRTLTRLSALVEILGWEGAKTRHEEVRRFLQRLGTGMRNVLGEDVWLNKVCDEVYDHKYVSIRYGVHPNAVITDVRFPNEAEWITQVGYLVRVTRPGFGPVNGHESETAIDDVPAFELINNGSVEDLRWLAARLPHMVKGLISL